MTLSDEILYIFFTHHFFIILFAIQTPTFYAAYNGPYIIGPPIG